MASFVKSALSEYQKKKKKKPKGKWSINQFLYNLFET